MSDSNFWGILTSGIIIFVFAVLILLMNERLGTIDEPTLNGRFDGISAQISEFTDNQVCSEDQCYRLDIYEDGSATLITSSNKVCLVPTFDSNNDKVRCQ